MYIALTLRRNVWGVVSEMWDATRYRALAEKWRGDAEALPPGREREVSLALANGYATLVAILDRLPENAEVQSDPSLVSQT
jgi:hypothetical protein